VGCLRLDAEAELNSAAASPSPDVAAELVGFATALREVGVPADTGRVSAALAALAQIDALDIDQVYWAGRLTLCAAPDDLARYDDTFQRWFLGRGAPTGKFVVGDRPFPLLPTSEADPPAGPAEHEDLLIRSLASAQEALAHRDVATLAAAEREEIRLLIQLLAPRTGRRRTLRYQAGRNPRIDLSRTVRGILANGGEPAELRRVRPRVKPRRLVLLIDVSGSMASYADALLRFGHAAARVSPGATEVFTLGTRLTRVTRQMRLRDPDQALAAAAEAIPDWSGGTRLGESLRAFLDLWGQRGTARGAVVLLFSDGWERGDPSLLGEQMLRLARLADHVVWVHPHQHRPGFAPATRGMLAALPYIDDLVSGHSLAAFEALAEVIGRI
jgi:uncharacterized protein with von Willebrand factor type A (vWA) domain